MLNKKQPIRAASCSDPVLKSGADFEHFGTANSAGTFNGWFAVFKGHTLGVVHFAVFGFALYTVSGHVVSSHS